MKTKYPKLNLRFITLALSLSCVLTQLSAADYYVAPDGNDTNSGSLASPFASIARARDAASSGDTVHLRGGNYFVTETIRFDQSHSGVTYQAYASEVPVVYGGVAITGWELDPADSTGKIWRAPIASDWDFHVLTHDHQSAPMARYPNWMEGDLYGHFELEDVANAGSWFTYSGPAFDETHAKIRAYSGNSGAWGYELRPIANRDVGDATKYHLAKEFANVKIGNRFTLFGSKDFIDLEGEWAIGSDGYVYYWPLGDVDPNTALITGSKIARILDVRSDSASSPVTGITFEGLHFMNSDNADYSTAAWDRSVPYSREAMIYMENAEHITVRYCRIRGVGANAISANLHCQHMTVYGNWIEDVGGIAVRMHGEELRNGEGVILGNDPEATTIVAGPYFNKFHTIKNNYIYGAIRMRTPVYTRTAIWLRQSGDSEISHNLIGDSMGDAIVLSGWAKSKYVNVVPEDHLYTRNNVIANNEAFDCMHSSLDVGILGTWGIGLANEIRHNLFRDSYHRTYYAGCLPGDAGCLYEKLSMRVAMYFDNNSGGQFVEGNLAYNIQDAVTFERKLDQIAYYKGTSTLTNQTHKIFATRAEMEAEAAIRGIDLNTIGLLSDFPFGITVPEVLPPDYRRDDTVTTDPVPAGDQHRITVSEDAYVRGGGDADINYGSNEELMAKEGSGANHDRIAYLKFDLSSLQGQGSITFARIYLYVRSSESSANFAQYVSDDSWSESTVTWNTRPGFVGEIDSWSVPDPGHFIDIDVKSEVVNELAADGTLTIAIWEPDGANTLTKYDSKEGQYVPELLVVTETAESATTYADWQMMHFSSTTSPESLEEADEDGDGYKNILEYALGADPMLYDVHLVRPLFSDSDLGGGVRQLTLEYPKLRSSLTYVVEQSSNLSSWDAAGVSEEGAGAQLNWYKRSVTLSAGEEVFLRLRVFN